MFNYPERNNNGEWTRGDVNSFIEEPKIYFICTKYLMIAWNLCITIFPFAYTLLYHNISCKWNNYDYLVML